MTTKQELMDLFERLLTQIDKLHRDRTGLASPDYGGIHAFVENMGYVKSLLDRFEEEIRLEYDDSYEEMVTLKCPGCEFRVSLTRRQLNDCTSPIGCLIHELDLIELTKDGNDFVDREEQEDAGE